MYANNRPAAPKSTIMKILFDHLSPFILAHGGFQIQIEQTKAALESVGVEVEFLRWWDASQRGDIIHFFGIPTGRTPFLAKKKGMKVVVTQLLGGLGVRPAWKRTIQKRIIGLAFKILPGEALVRAGWSAWRIADACIAVTGWEAQLMQDVFRVPPDRVHVVPNGVSDLFFERSDAERGRWLVTVASIFPVKRLLETARAAVKAGIPYWIIGSPLAETERYYQEFSAFCREHEGLIRYEKTMRTHAELAEIYRQARGFVLLSQWESQSLSALEAAASGCPLLLSELPWARSTFGESASYCPIASETRTAEYLKDFYSRADQLAAPSPPKKWSEIASILKDVYWHVLNEAKFSDFGEKVTPEFY